MKTYILSAVALAALASTALAQQPPAPPPAAGLAPIADPAAPPPPPGEPIGPAADRGAPPLRGPDGDMGSGDHRPPPPPPPSKAAHFRVEDGQTKIDIKCADDEPMKACSDILLQVLDHVKGLPRL